MELPAPAFEGADHVYHLFIVRSDRRDALREHLAQHDVATAVHYPFPIHRTGAYADLGLGAGSLPVAERLSEQICTLPLFPTMSDDEVAQVVAAVSSFDVLAGLRADPAFRAADPRGSAALVRLNGRGVPEQPRRADEAPPRRSAASSP